MNGKSSWLSWPGAFLWVVALAIVGPLLGPGYILALDMVWVPDVQAVWSADGLNNAYPIHVLFQALGTVLPAWVVQKVFLLGVVGALFYVPYRYLPTPAGWPRVVATLVFALNLFVYTRLLAGQWFVLLGYALLPLVLYVGYRWWVAPTLARSLQLAVTLALLGMVSAHYVYLLVCVGGIAGVGKIVWQRQWQHLRYLASVCLFLSVCMSYWLVPAMLREAPLETRFDSAHATAFAASEHADVLSTYANVAVLGGFWAEGGLWQYSVLWPHTMPLFWLGVSLIALLVVCGLVWIWQRQRTVFWVTIGCMAGAYVVSLGASDTFLQSAAVLMSEYVPGWSGLRDSTKALGFLALAYSCLAGWGVAQVGVWLQRRRLPVSLGVVWVVTPVCMGVLLYGGLRGQIAPVSYPAAWHTAQQLLATEQADHVLVLPWRGYYALAFADGRVVANVAPAFFSNTAIVAGRSVETGAVQTQEINPEYRKLATFLMSSTGHSPAVTAEWLRQQRITHLLVLEPQPAMVAGNWWLPEYAPRAAEARVVPQLLAVPHDVLLDKGVKLYRFHNTD